MAHEIIQGLAEIAVIKALPKDSKSTGGSNDDILCTMLAWGTFGLVILVLICWGLSTIFPSPPIPPKASMAERAGHKTKEVTKDFIKGLRE